jgi:hypothetical protein
MNVYPTPQTTCAASTVPKVGRAPSKEKPAPIRKKPAITERRRP